MRRFILIFIPLLIILIALGAFFYINKRLEKGALQITSIPKSNVYLDGELIGQTPLCKCELSDMIKVGEYSLKLIPLSPGLLPFEEKIVISKSILTVVDRTFGKDLSSSGSKISLTPLENQKEIELLVMSLPEKADVFLDSAKVGETPLILKDITESNHTLTLTKSGYEEKTVRINTVLGYKLLTTVFLALDLDSNKVSEKVKAEDNEEASKGASLKLKQVVISDTPTGFLRVRENASLDGLEIDRVFSGEKYDLISDENGWYEIKTKTGKQGFISSQYSNIE